MIINTPSKELLTPKWLRTIVAYLRCLTWVVVPFCLVVTCHYVFHFFPRNVEVSQDFLNHCQSLGVDYWGIIVGFLTLVITFLVGWQIYNTINAKQEFERHKEELDQSRLEINTQILLLRNVLNNKTEIDCKRQQAVDMALSNIYLSIITQPNLVESEYQYMYYSLCAIQGASILGDIEGCNLLVKVFNETVVNPSKIVLSKEKIEILKSNAYKISRQDEIIGYKTLLDKIYKISTNK